MERSLARLLGRWKKPHFSKENEETRRQLSVEIGVAIKVGMDAMEHAGRKADLAAAAGMISITGLRNATLGLKTDMELLEAAAKINQGQFKRMVNILERTADIGARNEAKAKEFRRDIASLLDRINKLEGGL